MSWDDFNNQYFFFDKLRMERQQLQPFRPDPLSPSSIGTQLQNSVNPSPHKPLYDLQIGTGLDKLKKY
ncbi:MAG: hypothetical protein KQH53_10765 [Desulfarculaceae bacterium]|nr:hypothetical protein [Desulfarculaceae bacterium]